MPGEDHNDNPGEAHRQKHEVVRHRPQITHLARRAHMARHIPKRPVAALLPQPALRFGAIRSNFGVFEVIGTGTPAGNAKEPCRVAEFQQSPTQHTASELFQSKFGVFWSNPAAHRAARPRFSRSVLLVDICRRVRLGKRPVTDW